MATLDIEVKSLGKWLDGRELLLTFMVCALTSLIGYLVHHEFVTLVLPVFEFFAGVVLWMAKRVCRFCDGLAKELANGAQKLDEICGILTQQEVDGVFIRLHDPKIAGYLRDILSSLDQLAEQSQLQFFVQEALGNTAQFSTLLANTAAPYIVRLKAEGEQLQRMLHTYIRGLPPNFVFETLTTLGFWCSDLLANPRAFLQTNVSMATKKSGKFVRVILTDKSTNELTTEEWSILETHFEYTNSYASLIETRVLKVPRSEMETYGHFAISRSVIATSKSLLLAHYAADGRIEWVEVLRKEELIDECAEAFRTAYSRAIPIGDYLRDKPLLAA